MRTDLASLATAAVEECRKRAQARLDAARNQCEMEKVEAILARQKAVNASWWRRFWRKPPVTLEEAEASFKADVEWITALEWADIRLRKKEEHLQEVFRLCNASCDGKVQLSPFHAAVLGFAAA